MNDSSIIMLNENSIVSNIAFLKRQFGKKTMISAVVKANAYGHGIEQVVPLMEKNGIDHFSVFDYREAVRVRKSLVNGGTIMIMGWISDENLKLAIEEGFEFFVFNTERLKKVCHIASKLKIRAKIHLEVETGMNRSGLDEMELKDAMSYINDHAHCFEIIGLCTHLAGAESIANHYRIQQQLKKFNKISVILKSNNINPKYHHVANSAAAIVYPKTRMDLVRVGIMQYGFWPSKETFIHFISNKISKDDPLKRILNWKSKVMAVKEVKIGEFISYGNSFLAQSNITTAIIPVGYAGGYSRNLSNRGRVLIHGQRCSVIGIVNMNMFIADISNLQNVKVGDEVVIIGKQGDLEIKVSAFSDISDKLNYEILTHLPENIKRKIIKS